LVAGEARKLATINRTVAETSFRGLGIRSSGSLFLARIRAEKFSGSGNLRVD